MNRSYALSIGSLIALTLGSSLPGGSLLAEQTVGQAPAPGYGPYGGYGVPVMPPHPAYGNAGQGAYPSYWGRPPYPYGNPWRGAYPPGYGYRQNTATIQPHPTTQKSPCPDTKGGKTESKNRDAHKDMAEVSDKKDAGNTSGDEDQKGMSGMQGQKDMAGMSGMSGMQGQQGMAGMSGMSGMQGQQGMAGMKGTTGFYWISPTGETYLFPHGTVTVQPGPEEKGVTK